MSKLRRQLVRDEVESTVTLRLFQPTSSPSTCSQMPIVRYLNGCAMEVAEVKACAALGHLIRAADWEKVQQGLRTCDRKRCQRGTSTQPIPLFRNRAGKFVVEEPLDELVDYAAAKEDHAN